MIIRIRVSQDSNGLQGSFHPTARKLDQAGWHGSDELIVPYNFTIKAGSVKERRTLFPWADL